MAFYWAAAGIANGRKKIASVPPSRKETRPS